LGVIYQNFWLYRRTIPYYQNFIQYLSHEESEYDYRNFFDPNVNRDYQIAEFVAQHSSPTDTIYVWGDNPEIYKVSNRFPPGRYTVAYHVTFNPDGVVETQNVIKNKKPKFFIVIRRDVPKELFPTSFIQKTTLGSAEVYEQ
jgi:hypothetical protein